MASPVVVGYSNSPVLRVQYTFTAAANGTFTAQTCDDDRIKGMVVAQVDTTPGTPNPTASWAATLKDVGLRDLMGGAITARSASAKEAALPLYATGVYYQPAVKDTLTLAPTGNSVNGAVIVVDVWLWRA